MSSALILTNNNSTTAVSANGTVPLGSAVHGYGKGIQLNGNEIAINSAGYYNIHLNVTAAPTAATIFEIQMYLNGVAVGGAYAAAVPAAAGSEVNLGIDWVVRKTCCADASRIGFVAVQAANIENVVLEVAKS